MFKYSWQYDRVQIFPLSHLRHVSLTTTAALETQKFHPGNDELTHLWWKNLCIYHPIATLSQVALLVSIQGWDSIRQSKGRTSDGRAVSSNVMQIPKCDKGPTLPVTPQHISSSEE